MITIHNNTHTHSKKKTVKRQRQKTKQNKTPTLVSLITFWNFRLIVFLRDEIQWLPVPHTHTYIHYTYFVSVSVVIFHFKHSNCFANASEIYLYKSIPISIYFAFVIVNTLHSRLPISQTLSLSHSVCLASILSCSLCRFQAHLWHNVYIYSLCFYKMNALPSRDLALRLMYYTWNERP